MKVGDFQKEKTNWKSRVRTKQSEEAIEIEDSLSKQPGWLTMMK